MKRVLVDSTDKIIYEGTDSKEVLRVLTADPSDVSEQDEVNYLEHLTKLTWIGQLNYEVHFELEFRGIDDWHRPVFKDVNSTIYFGSTKKLYGYNEFQKEGLQYFKDNPTELEYFGSSFNCEPHGGLNPCFKFTFVEW